METYQAGRDHILKATLRVETNLCAKMEQVKKRKLICFTLITEEVQSPSNTEEVSPAQMENYAFLLVQF
jgi:hypothetical protein